MPRIKPNSETSGLESLQKWNTYYTNNTFPIIICCDSCGKWRETSEFEEISDVPESWDCSMWIRSNGKKGNCKIPSDVNENDYVDEDYTPGSLVWARMNGHPKWPAMIEDDPDEEEYCKDLETDAKYHVVFLGDPPSRCWINAKRLEAFKMPTSDEVGRKPFKGKKLRNAVEEAERAMKMTKKKRLLACSFAARLENKRIKDNNEKSSEVKAVQGESAIQKNSEKSDVKTVERKRAIQKDTGGSSKAKKIRKRKGRRKNRGKSSAFKSDRKRTLLQKYTGGKISVNLFVVESDSDETEYGQFINTTFPSIFKNKLMESAKKEI